MRSRGFHGAWPILLTMLVYVAFFVAGTGLIDALGSGFRIFTYAAMLFGSGLVFCRYVHLSYRLGWEITLLLALNLLNELSIFIAIFGVLNVSLIVVIKTIPSLVPVGVASGFIASAGGMMLLRGIVMWTVSFETLRDTRIRLWRRG